jgi:hypothetical protein
VAEAGIFYAALPQTQCLPGYSNVGIAIEHPGPNAQFRIWFVMLTMSGKPSRLRYRLCQGCLRLGHLCSQGDFGQIQIPIIHGICLAPVPGDIPSAQSGMRIDPHSRDLGFGPSRHSAMGPCSQGYSHLRRRAIQNCTLDRNSQLSLSATNGRPVPSVVKHHAQQRGMHLDGAVVLNEP